MSQGVIARRYAKALMGLADRGQTLEPVEQSLSELAETYESSLELQGVIASTKVPPAAKRAVLGEVLDALKPHAQVDVFARFLLSKRRLALIPDIHRAFHRLVQERLARIEAEVTVTHPLPEEAREGLRKELSEYSGKDVSLSVQIDPTILGGVVTRIGSEVIDGSLRTQLEQVRQSIIQG
ncbi:MAG TPA: ATP synthase F1 subunit delta [Deltaproteobacteria bacterium]|nr:ATP synthase F1 subunit delta [Deltaproteobacteria bacterium]